MALDLEVAASLTLGDMEKVGDSVVSRLKQSDPRPFYLARTDSDIGNGTTPITLDLGSPPTGSIWQVRSITVFGVDDHTVLANILCALYTGDPALPALPTLRIVGLAIPSTVFIPDTAIWCHPNENLTLVTSDVIVAGQQVGANVVVEEWKEHMVSRNSGK